VASDVIERLARERLGFERLRAGQLPAVEALVDGRDALAVLPTGAGKSAIYELAGLLREGPTVVVSPLIALEDDQLAHLRSAGLHAILLNSRQSAGSRAAALLAACQPDTFVFLSPEQLANEETRQTLRRAAPGLFVVDEAHLISQWGHDFRPDYMMLGAQAQSVGAPVRLALTATAAPPVREEIIRRLGLRDPRVVIGDFDRPNIYLSVRRALTVKEKQQHLTEAATELAGAGIVYAATHANAQAAHDTLAAGERVTLYHAGLPGQRGGDRRGDRAGGGPGRRNRQPGADGGARPPGRPRRGGLAAGRLGPLEWAADGRGRAEGVGAEDRTRGRGRAFPVGDDAPLRGASRLPAVVPADLLRAGFLRFLRQL